MKIGAARITLKWFGFRREMNSTTGYARAAGIHFDMWGWHFFGLSLTVMRLRESDMHPECHAGYLIWDRLYNPNLPSYERYY